MDPDGLVAIAERTEALGFRYLGLSDHLVIARDVASPYPYTKSRVWFAQDSGDCLDQLTSLGFVAAATSTIRLLTSVMVIPHRPPVLTAKMLTTLDHLSGGRLTVGVGVGWMAEEIALLGAPTFKDRGRLANEYIEAFRALWTEADPSYKGEYVEFGDLRFEPKPVQKPHPPIWIGGETRPARRRAGRMGDGWYPVGNNPGSPYDTVERFSRGLGDVSAEAEKAGRDPASIEIGLNALWYRLGEAVTSEEGARMPFTGDAAAIIDDICAYGEAGMETLVIGFESNELAQSLDRIEAFAAEIMAKID